MKKIPVAFTLPVLFALIMFGASWYLSHPEKAQAQDSPAFISMMREQNRYLERIAVSLERIERKMK